MARKNKQANQAEIKSDFGTLPNFLTDDQAYIIETGHKISGSPVTERDKPYYEWLAKGFGLTPFWKKTNTQVENHHRGGIEG